MKEDKTPGIHKILCEKLNQEPAIYTIGFILALVVCSALPIGIIVSGVTNIIRALMIV